MTEKKDYTFCLSPGEKTRYIAGPYDKEKNEPKYSIEISAPEHAKRQVEIKSFLLRSGDTYKWAYEVHNKSSWAVFLIVRVDNRPILEDL